MLTGYFQRFAEEQLPGLFEKGATETARIVRAARAVNAFGGATRGGETESDDIPCVVEPRPTHTGALGSRWVSGDEYLDARIRMPAYFNGDPIEAVATDRIRILASPGNNPERLYEIRDPQNIHGVYLDIGVVTADRQTVEV